MSIHDWDDERFGGDGFDAALLGQGDAMTDDVTVRLEQIKARCEKATKGPWTMHHRCYGCGPGDDERCGLGWEWDDEHCPPEPQLRGALSRFADAEFVTNARDDLPWCIAQIERLLAENAALKQRK